MQSVPHVGRMLRSRQALTLAMTAALILSGACSQDRGTTAPSLPPNPPGNPQFKSAAFLLDVNPRTGKVTITPPKKPAEVAGQANGVQQGPGIQRSILAGDAVLLTASNFNASAVGAFQPNKIRVTFDINITNRLASVDLITPTFPVPPAGVTGVLLFPFENVVTVTSGGVSTGGDGTDIIIELPSNGQVAPSTDWDGAPFNFFNDTGCPAGQNDCYRYETYATPLVAGSTSEVHSVGFDIDPTVGNFRARLIVAADLQNSGPAPTGSIAGNVTSPQLGALTGVLVTANAGGFTGTTAAGGAYSIANVTTGPKTVSLSNLPAGCTDPGSQSTTVTNGGTSTVNFTVQCTVPSGTIAGTITSSLGGGINGVQVTVTPTGGSAIGPVSTGATGAYSVPNVPVGSGDGSITFANVPGNCTNPGPQTYSGLTAGNTVTRDFTFSCTPPPAFYQVTHTWSAGSSANTRLLTIKIDMTTRNDPLVNGANPDDIGAFQGTLVFDPTKIVPVNGSESATSAPRLGNVVVQTYTSGNTLNYGAFDAVAGGRLGNVGIIQIEFTLVAGGSTITTQLQSGATLYANSSTASGTVGYGPSVVNVNVSAPVN